MSFALICTEGTFDVDLADTLLWRGEVERHVVHSAEEGMAAARAWRPDLVVIDRDLAQAARLIAEIRRDTRTRRVSVIVVARADFEPVEIELLEVGANAILRLPASAEWDDRLARLVAVPTRREVRLPVHFELETQMGPGVQAAVATVLNLSVNGILIETDTELRVGDDLDLRFNLPEGGATVSGCGHIVRQAGRRRYGVEFYGLEADGPELVRNYVDRQETPGASSSQL
jgi:CheY-like chemotaxis protein